jgi:Cu-Zn family superoxide dismutase
MKRTTSIFTALIVASALGITLPGPAAAEPAPSSAADSSFVHVSAEFAPADSGADALTHNPDLVPVGARATVTSLSTQVGTVTVLRVRGVVPHHEYGGHVHVGTCGADPLASGPHYQHVPDPVQPSVDPAYANPRNEIWLDFRADARGNGLAVSTVRWQFDDRPAGAVVLHERFTSTEPGEAGVAGARVGCVNVPFAP